MKKIKSAVFTTIGNVRRNNQDNFYCNGTYKEMLTEELFYKETVEENGYHIYGVMDGMGGLCLGEEAALAAVENLDKYIKRKKMENACFSGEKAIQYMNWAVCDKSNQKNVLMGSTVVLLKYENGKVQIYNIGDSKAFLFRDNYLEQLSEDHTEEERFIRMRNMMGYSGEMPHRNGLTQFLGIAEEEFVLEPGISAKIDVHDEDIFLLCSDGLTECMEERTIKKVLEKENSLEDKAKVLVDMAINSGGRDNITILLLKIIEN